MSENIRKIQESISDIELNNVDLFHDSFETYDPCIWFFYIVFGFDHVPLKEILSNEHAQAAISVLDKYLQLDDTIEWGSREPNMYNRKVMQNQVSPKAIFASEVQVTFSNWGKAQSSNSILTPSSAGRACSSSSS